MKWIKKNKLTGLIIIIFLLITTVSYKAVKVFFPDVKSAIYGDRLEGKVKVDKDVYSKVKEKLSSQEFVKTVTVRENGRTINVSVQILDSTSMDSAKSLPNMILEFFNDSQKSYFDFQMFIGKEDKSEDNFPIIAYKQHNSSEFSFTKDRAKTEKVNEENK